MATLECGVNILGYSRFTVTEYSPQRHLSACPHRQAEFAEFGVFFDQKLFTLRPPRLRGAISESGFTQKPAEPNFMRNPGVAAVLSVIIPGIGQIYNGQFLWAIFWFILTPGLWVGSAGLLGWICHIVSAYLAYSYAQKNPQR
jgi:TM2 domain-containing membrane protein YozV